MTTRRRRTLLLASPAAVVAVGVGLAFGLHWRAYGLCRREPFWHTMPASYWRSEAARGRPAGVLSSVNGLSFDPAPADVSGVTLVCPEGPLHDFAARLRQLLGLKGPAPFGPHTPLVMREPDAGAVPVLLALLDDGEPSIRAYACRELALIGPAASAAVPALRRRLNDDEEVAWGFRVAQAVANALRAIDPSALGDAAP